MSDREESAADPDFDAEARKRKSKSPSTFLAAESKRAKAEMDDLDTDDIAKQYKKFKSAPKFNLNSEELYCVCRKLDNGTLMISCDNCEEWFHTRCMKIDLQHLDLLDRFFCKFCQWKGKGVTHWNRKCRMPSCFKPARVKEQSKYCSEECAMSFLRQKLVGSPNFTEKDIAFVINHCGSHAELELLGLQFPELAHVQKLDMERLTREVREMVTKNDLERKELEKELEAVLKTRAYIELIRKRTELINEKAHELLRDDDDETENAKKSKKKRSKPRKTDLCCFDQRVYQIVNQPGTADTPNLERGLSVYEMFQQEIDDALREFSKEDLSESAICLTDRRKCLRHSGWYNLLQDRTWKRQVELQEALDKLKALKDGALREYSISVYEKDECSPDKKAPEMVVH